MSLTSDFNCFDRLNRYLDDVSNSLPSHQEITSCIQQAESELENVQEAFEEVQKVFTQTLKDRDKLLVQMFFQFEGVL